MAPKPQPLILELSDFRVYLFAQMRIRGLSPQDFADELGVDLSSFYKLLSGEGTPTPELVDKVGLRLVYAMKDPAPKKEKK